MTTLHLVWQIAFAAIALGFVYWFLIRPWRRDGRPSTDGLLCVAIAFLFFQDPLSSFTGHWFTYNMNLLQYGSWVNEIPGWMAFGAPGENVGEPLVFTGAVYIWAFFGMTLLGCAIMRAARSRWPTLRTPWLIGICFLTLFVADVVLEGLIWLPLGFLTYPGGHWMRPERGTSIRSTRGSPPAPSSPGSPRCGSSVMTRAKDHRRPRCRAALGQQRP